MSLRKNVLDRLYERRGREIVRRAVREWSGFGKIDASHRHDARPHPDFGDFRLDPVSGQLYRGAQPSRSRPRRSRCCSTWPATGRLVSKQELLDAVWPDVFVGDAVLKSTIRELRKALGDDSHAPRFIETAHRRGYRFMAPVHDGRRRRRRRCTQHTAARQLRAQRQREHRLPGRRLRPDRSRLRHGLGVAPRVLLERAVVRAVPDAAASMARLILFDKRGTGLSDPVPVSELPTLEQRLDDVRAVMEAAGSERAVLLGVSEGGPMCSLFAATYPGKDRSADHDRQLRAAAAGRRLSVGPDARGARRVLPDDHRRVGRPGRHRGARAVAWLAIRRSASGGRRTCAWARAPAPPSR